MASGGASGHERGYAGAMSSDSNVVVVGNFDGLHKGHQLLFERARAIADAAGGQVVAMPFTRHPLLVLRPDKAPPMLLHRDQRAELLPRHGVDVIEWLEPGDVLLKQTPEQFIGSIVERYQPIAVVEGTNFHFGRNRAGDTSTLDRLGSEQGFEAEIVSLLEVSLRDKTVATVSSSLVRWLIGHGRVADATLCLGRPWQMQGVVIEGDQRGRTLGTPTANLDTDPQMHPANGVYAGLAEVDGRTHAAALNVGWRPTFKGRTRCVEAHLLDFAGDLYGRTLRIDLYRRLRDEWRFADVDALRHQLNHDLAYVRALLEDQLLDPAALAVGYEAPTL